ADDPPLIGSLIFEERSKTSLSVVRIIHFLNHTRPNNGHVHVAVDLACVQSRMGHSVSVVSGGGAFDPLFAAYGVKHIVIDQKRTLSNLIRATNKLRSAISSFSPDII